MCERVKRMKKIPYGRQTIIEEDIKEVVDVLRSDFITQGPRINEFEKTVAEYHGAKYGVAFSNGTAALHGAYSVLQIEPGNEIITTPITFLATSNAAIYCGLKPVFADIDKDTNCIAIDSIEDKITDQTKVISPVSFAGYPVDLKRIREIADRHNCYIIHDAAHATGSKRGGTFGMEYADLAILSFHPVKHVATGEGGMVLTNNEELYQRLLRFRSHGTTKDARLLTENHGPWYYEMQSLGFNYRMTDIQAALGCSQFKRIETNLIDRNKIASRYTQELSKLDFLTLPPQIGYKVLEVGTEKAEDIHSYHLYTIQTASKELRKPLYEYLHSKGVMVQIHYLPVTLQPYYKEHFGTKEGDCPHAEDYYSKVISIPMYHNMKADDLEYVISTIKEFERLC